MIAAAYLEKLPLRQVTLTWRDDAGRGTRQKPGCNVAVPLIVTCRERKALNRNYINYVRSRRRPSRDERHTFRPQWHVLRRHYASVLLDAGESILAVSRNLGHADPSITLRGYIHLTDTKGRRTKSAIDAAFRAHLAAYPHTIARHPGTLRRLVNAPEPSAQDGDDARETARDALFVPHAMSAKR